MATDLIGITLLDSFQKVNFTEETGDGIVVEKYDHLVDYLTFTGKWDESIGGMITEDGKIITTLDPVIAHREGWISDRELKSCINGGWTVVMTVNDHDTMDMVPMGFAVPDNITVLRGAL